MKKTLLFLILIFFLFTKEIFAIDQKLLKQIENYLNGLDKISSSFIQSSSNGYEGTGKMFLSKPGKLRVEYDKDDNLLMVADGKWLHYFDTELNEIQSIVIEKSPAWILLKKNINLKNDFNIKKIQNKSGKITLTIIDKKFENTEKVELIFSSNPISLKKWIVNDNQGVETTVALLNINRKVKFKPKTFKLITN